MTERGMQTGDSQRRLRSQVSGWRDELINLTRTNRLLYFRHTQTASLEITAPGMDKVHELLDKGKALEFFEPPVDANGRPTDRSRALRANEVLTDKTTPLQLSKSLRGIEKRALDTFTERGLWTMYVGLGFLNWVDGKDGKRVDTPLLLQPVEFGRASLSEPFRLRATDDDAIINPALVVKMSNDFDIHLPSADELDELTPATLFAALRRVISTRPEWTLQDRVVLHPFSFLKEAMYRDLLDNEESVTAHRLVQVLALGSDASGADALAFQPVAFEHLDATMPPEELHHVRDADASQRRCVLAARAGHSFVMDGPPGTGKSQTITNIISELLFEGKTVLFVSDKAAALEVVFKRLREAHLDEFTLELHSHNATRKAVAHELGNALTRRPRATPTMTDVQRMRLTSARMRLADYAAAMNEVRRPLNRSLHDVLGRLAELRSAPSAPPPQLVSSSLAVATFSSITEAAEALGRAWGPIERSDGFLWRDLATTETGPAVFEGRRRALGDTMDSFDRLATRLESVNTELGLGLARSLTEAERVLALLELLDRRPPIPADWLSTPRPDRVQSIVADAAPRVANLNASISALNASHRDGWRAFHPSLREQVADHLKALSNSAPIHPASASATGAQLRARAAALEAAAQGFDMLSPGATRLADGFGVERSKTSSAMLDRLARLAQLASPPQRPEPAWLDRTKANDVAEARGVLDAIIGELRSARTRAEQVFRPTVVELDLRALRARFADVHTGLRKLGGAYRADKQLLAPHVLSGKVTSTIIDRLPDAIALQAAAQSLAAAETSHAPLLGQYYRGDDTSFDRVDQALKVAQEALAFAGADVPTASLQRQLSSLAEPDEQFVAVGTQVLNQLLQIDTQVRSELTAVSVFEAAPLLRRAAHDLHVLADDLDAVQTATGTPCSSDEALRLAERVGLVEELERWLEANSAALQGALGGLFAGTATDFPVASAALGWADAVIRCVDRPMSIEQARALLRCTFASDDVRQPLQEARALVVSCVEPFVAQRRDRLQLELASSFSDAGRLLASLHASVGDADEWVRHTSATAELRSHGLADVVQFCIDRRVSATEVAPAIERSVLDRWASSVLHDDERRLSPLSSADRDGLVDDFRRFDERLAADSAATVLNVCADRRPTTIVGETQVIKREAEKQRRHMPIRTLMDKAGRAAQTLKPCFMMSPLSVSQYLPSDMRFDVVIFDEASQVRPSDAINCVYRGRQLIVAGDQRQLPPTAFFQLASTDTGDTYDEDELDDFQSVLDLAKAAGAMPSLPLSWHYRSEHEALITYSNRRFYEDALTTFPSSLQEADDIGIEFFKVDGVYERGGSRTNPMEARKVVERVLFHRRRHPHLSIGVIAFSVAQQEAIEAAIEEEGFRHPDLLALLSDDRLDRFFVKNLENVQGDERDIILFSVGYGPDAEGKLSMNFGPLIRPGGWRRLNVAITRARRRVEVIASFLPTDIPASSSNEGTRHLRGYLEFARSGSIETASEVFGAPSSLASPVADVVATIIEEWGYQVDRSVGAGTLRVDVGVRDPQRPGAYLLGIQCDGQNYGSAAVTRDRDRLTQSVLAGLGWRLHRVWSTAWFRDTDVEVRRLREAINAAIVGEPVASASPRAPGDADRPPAIRHEEVDAEVPPWATFYRCYPGPKVYSTLPPHHPDARTELRSLIVGIVAAEGPISIDRLVRQVRVFWPVGSTGAKTTDCVQSLVQAMMGVEIVSHEDGFVMPYGQKAVVVRVPDPDDERTKRVVDDVPWSELGAAVMHVVQSASSVSDDDLTTFVARLYGWGRTGVQIGSAISSVISDLVSQGHVRRTEGLLSIAD